MKPSDSDMATDEASDEVEIEPIHAVRKTAKAGGTMLWRRRAYRVLVADDHPINRRILQSRLQGFGIEVELAEDGMEALSMVHAGDFDAVFMDCSMPRMDGFDATRMIRGLASSAARVPIIASSAFSSPEDRTRCLAAGMDGFLSKPVSHRHLLETLQAWGLDELAAPAGAPAPTWSAPRAVVVDDDRISSSLVSKALKRAGCQVRCAEGVEELMDPEQSRTQLAKVDLLVVDIIMPRFDGVDVCRALRSRRGPERMVPMVALTGHDDLEQRRRCLAAGFDAFVSKPLTPNHIDSLLDIWLRHHTRSATRVKTLGASGIQAR